MNARPTFRLRVLPALIPVDGRAVELQATDTYIQWRYAGDEAWLNLVPLSALRGPVGPKTEFQSNGTYIQYRAEGEVAWTDLVPLEELRGLPGPEGPPGPQGPSVGDGDKGDLTVSGGGTTWTLDQVVSEGKVVPTSTDALRVTISHLSYPKGLVKNDPAAAAANLAAIQAKLVSGAFCELPDGQYSISSSIQMPSWAKLIGHGPQATILTTASDSINMIVVPASSAYYEIANFSLKRSVTPLLSAAGIRCLGSSQLSAVRHMDIQDQGIGMVMWDAGYGHIEHNFVSRCLSHGMFFTTGTGHVPIQWVLIENFVQLCGGDGFRVEANAVGDTGISMGSWINNRTFANSGYGMAFLGRPARPIQGVRIEGAFVGEDGNHEIYLDTYGGMHMIHGVFVERTGMRTTGPDVSTPATLTGDGIHITLNNTDVKIVDVTSNFNSRHGIYTAATERTTIVGGNLFRNGYHVPAGADVAGTDGSKVAIIGVGFGSGVTASTGGTTAFTTGSGQRQVIGCLPVSVNRSLRASFVHDFGSIAAGATASVTSAVTGVAPGDIVLVSTNVPNTGLIYSAQATASGIVTVYAQNTTGSAIDPGIATLRLLIDKT